MINWSKIQRRNPQNHALSWYPTIALNSHVTADDVIVGIVEKCTLTKVDVKAVLIALEEVIIEQLKAGNAVRFGDLGSFRPTLKTRVWNDQKKRYEHGGCPVPTTLKDKDGKVTAMGVTDDNIAGISCVFTKSGEMGRKLDRKQLKFLAIDLEKPFPTKS